MEDRARIVIAVLLGAAILCWPALYNGYPFLYPDSPAYVEIAAEGYKPWSRSIYYGYLIGPVHMNVSLWLVVVVQSLIAAHLVYLTLRVTLDTIQPFTYLAVIVLLAALSPLPWVGGFVLPDIFGGFAVLALFLLGIAPNRLSRAESVYVFCLAVAAIATHNAYLPMALGVACIVVVVNSVRFGWRGASAGLLGAVLPAALGIAAIVVTNVAYHGVERAAGYGSIFALARLQEDGPATAYLRDRCPDAGYNLCAYLDDLPMWSNDFLWHARSPLYKAGGPLVLADEASAIVRGAVIARPWPTLEAAIANWRDQVLMLSLKTQRWSLANHDWHFRTIGNRFSTEQETMASARQQTDTLGLYFLDSLLRTAALVSLVLCLMLLWPLVRWHGKSVAALIVVVVTGLLINAFVSGAISEPLPRNNARMIWLIDLAAMISVLWLLRHRRALWSGRRKVGYEGDEP
ncbi:MAG: hypothetical protein GY791_09420 [Alphaproteobacteria bacterium]|nr:hypothetical protein [Alphaproteobacteria bacterium]